jgi:nucleoid DNA-binding protein
MANSTTAAQFTARLADNIAKNDLTFTTDEYGDEVLSKKSAAHILDVASALMIDEFASGQDVVAVKGFGRFKLVATAAKPRRKARNPATGEEIWAKAKPAGRKLKFAFEKAFKDALKAS